MAARAAALAQGAAVAVIPAGERWPDGSLRSSIEDLIGAGAVIEALGSLLPGSRNRQTGILQCSIKIGRLLRNS